MQALKRLRIFQHYSLISCRVRGELHSEEVGLGKNECLEVRGFITFVRNLYWDVVVDESTVS